MKRILSAIKPYLRWFILGATFFFIIKNFKDHWQQVAEIRLDSQAFLMLFFALILTFLAHIWSSWVWTWILKMFDQPCQPVWAIPVYLKTNMAKYLPGNIWHYYGRISAVVKAGGTLGAASLSVLLEPLLMAAAALIVTLTNINERLWILQSLGLGVVLLGIHPRIINPILHYLSRLKGNAQETKRVELINYPLIPLLGELGFLGLRASGFLLALMALMSVDISRLPQVLSVFSFAWLLGLLVPGAPGGLGVFEATAIALFDAEYFPPGVILSTVAFYRVISILAEVWAAGLTLIKFNYN